MYEVKLEWESVEGIVRKVLQEDYKSLLEDTKFPFTEIDPDTLKVRKALRKVIKYYSTKDQYEAWEKSFK